MMHAPDSLNLIQKHRIELSKAFARNGSCVTPQKSRQILADYLAYLERELSVENVLINVGQVQEMLLEVSCIIRSGRANIAPQEYRIILKRLTAIYAEGFIAHGTKDAFSITAVDYADVIEAISGAFPDFDYSEAVGQLLYYMNRLFTLRKSGWMTVYEHIISMPDSIKAIQLLKEEYFLEIQKWAEEGVDNLFQIRKDLAQRMDTLDQEVAEIGIKIKRIEDRLESRRYSSKSRRGAVIFDLAAEREKKEINLLIDERDQRRDESEGKEQIIELIESNIREFEIKLKETRRAYFVRLVYVSG
ncbi:MAG: hypothetical protein RPU64_06965 [Candidatus Sedimenticola sp. (ex Thyasira tokunagai)]